MGTAGAPAFGRRGLRPPSPSRAAPRPDIEEEAEPADDTPTDAQKLLGAIPMLTVGLVVGLGAIFGLEQHFAFDVGPGSSISQESSVALGAASRDLVFQSWQVWRIFLAPLLHGSSSHLLGNCLAMALVGFQLEPIVGRGWYALIFVLSALGGVAGSLIGNDPSMTTVGASGAITGLIAATFVMSFHERADDADVWKMRRRALFFGVPALAPLIWGAHGHTDYHAHLGGALVGAGIALALAFTWDGASFRPRGAALAAKISAGWVAVAMAAAACIPLHYAEQAAVAKTLLPDSIAEQPMETLSKRSQDLLARYPGDPRVHIIRAVALADIKQFGEAERRLLDVEAMPWPARRFAETSIHEHARALRAVMLSFDHHELEAREIARAICSDRQQSESWPMLRKAKLCAA